MKVWDEVWHSPIRAVRPWLFERLLLLLLAFDAWFLEAPHGGRLGAGGFNVAHAAWLGAMLPTPTPALYVGLMLGIGALAFAGAVGGASRTHLALVTAGWTWGWSMSLLDTWQHHYLLTLLLTCLCLSARGVGRDGVVADGWAWRLAASTVAIVYLYAAIAKIDGDWLAGDDLRVAAHAALAPVVDILGPSAFQVLAIGAIVTEFSLCIAYIASLWIDRLPALRWPLAVAGTVGAGFHIAIQESGFKIGWFSAYMVLSSCVFLMPEGALQRVAGWLPAREVPGPRAWAVLGGVGLLTVGVWANLPGGGLALGLAAGLLVVFGWRRSAVGIGGVAAAASLAGLLETTDVRFDYYRLLGGDLRHLGDLRGAIDAYRLADVYAPPGEDRTVMVSRLEAEIGSAGSPATSGSVGPEETQTDQ